jgi:hypothetical protein
MKSFLSKFSGRKSGAGQKRRQAGVALLLTVMIVSGITIITTTVAFFVIQEIRANRGALLTEPAIIAAETASEQGVFRVKKSNFNTLCSSNPAYTTLSGSATASDIMIRTCLTSVPATFQIVPGASITFYLYDPANVNGNTCLEDGACPADGNGAGNQLYQSIVLEQVTGSYNVDVDVDTLDGIDYRNTTIPATGTKTATVGIDRNILGSSDERLKVTITASISGSTTVRVSTTGLLTGIPDYQTLDAEGCAAFGVDVVDCNAQAELYKRRINVTLPR